MRRRFRGDMSAGIEHGTILPKIGGAHEYHSAPVAPAIRVGEESRVCP